MRPHWPPEWHERAACRDRGIDFFPHEAAHLGTREVRRAVRLCVGCPVRRDCLAYALRHETLGIWGGTVYRQRMRFRGAPIPSAVEQLIEETDGNPYIAPLVKRAS